MKLNDYYQDRGIKKFMGFYLSEHTRELEKDNKISTHVNFGLEQMSASEISEVIEFALLKNVPVSIQLNIKNVDGKGFRDNIDGLIAGFNSNVLYIDNICISMNLIRNIELISTGKWYRRNEG